MVEKYQPTDNGESPLATIKEFVETTCPSCGGPASRETDVMPNWAGSSWYFLRYCDPQNAQEFASMEKLKFWMDANSPAHSSQSGGGVDWYNGGMEHTVLHLLYSRFWHKFLFDIGLVPTPEPYAKRTSHGLILAGDGTKMSKSKGNVVNPDELVNTVGADSLRLYEMFMGPFEQAIAWSTDGVVGARRFLERVWNMSEKVSEMPLSGESEVLVHQTIRKVTEDIEALKMNTAVSALMILSNHLHELEKVPKEAYAALLGLLSPFVPHLSAELAERHAIDLSAWPQFDAKKAEPKALMVAVQVNGKVRGSVSLSPQASETEALESARKDPTIAKWLSEGEEKRAVYVRGRVINFVLDR
jgi:leucyl-tRNA synthetase